MKHVFHEIKQLDTKKKCLSLHQKVENKKKIKKVEVQIRKMKYEYTKLI